MTGFKRAGRLVLVVVILAGVHTQLSQAATFTVTTGTDGGPGSLRQAIIDADALGGASDINLQPGVTYSLTIPDSGPGDTAATGDLDIAATITLHGNGASISAGPGFNDRIIEVTASGSLAADHLTISGGFAACGAPRFSGDVSFDGGGIQ